MKIFLTLLFGLCVLLFALESDFEAISGTVPKINGASLVNPHQPTTHDQLDEVHRINVDWVAVIPFGFSRQNEPEVYFNHERQWWGERLEGAAALIQQAKSVGLKVMLKPHVWMREGWIGDYELDTEEKWKTWENHYTTYIMAFAQMADSLDVEVLCIGTELKKTEMNRSSYWSSLIPEIRKVYHGKLTYSSNWDHYDQVTFWGLLDYIGVNAYFPLTAAQDQPSIEILENAWKPIKSDLKKISKQFDRPILFTEYGYASCNSATTRPWEEGARGESPNLEIQALAYECFYRSFWNEPWIAGGFFWKWHFNNDPEGRQAARFTPQNKPAEEVIKKWYQISDE